MPLEDAFTRLTGRSPSGPELERLYRVRDALGLRDNDAFWSIVMALEHYDSFFRAYPQELAEVTSRTIDNVRAACAAAAAQEVALVQKALADQVAETSVRLARKLADKPFALHPFALALAAVVAFGALSLHAGYDLASHEPPFWIPHARTTLLHGWPAVLAAILSVPAGWMIFALLLPAAAHGVRAGWALGTDAMAEPPRRAAGWALVVLSLLGGLSCVALIAEVT